MKKILALLFMLFAATAYAIPPMPSGTPPVGTITGLFTGEGDYLKSDGTKGTPNGSGDVVGPASSTDNAIARFDSTTGKLLQNSLVTADDNGSINIPSGQTYKINNVPIVSFTYTVGTSANNLVQLDSSGKLPAVDGSQLTGISSGSGTAGKVCKTITNPSDADNILFDIASARTITKISGICVGGTSAVITLQDAGADGSGSTSIDDAITMDTDGANGGTISYVVHDGDIIKLDIGTVTGVVTQLMVCYE